MTNNIMSMTSVEGSWPFAVGPSCPARATIALRFSDPLDRDELASFIASRLPGVALEDAANVWRDSWRWAPAPIAYSTRDPSSEWTVTLSARSCEAAYRLRDVYSEQRDGEAAQ